ncbi:MAG: zinc ribbon domain-containing protein [Halanaeroarchaeum sp.]
MTGRYRFDCPGCAIDFEVDAGVRDDILGNGCPICGAPVTEAAFSVRDTQLS